MLEQASQSAGDRAACECCHCYETPVLAGLPTRSANVQAVLLAACDTCACMPDGASQEQKWRRQQGLDSLPPWSTAGDAGLANAMTKALHGLCFCAVKR